jgi:hypothetical protein
MKKIRFLIRDASGAITAMTIIMMIAFVGIMAVVIDLGHLHTVQNELRNAADACALRGARGFLPDDVDSAGLKTVPPSPDDAKGKAQLTIDKNKSDNQALDSLPLGDMTVGIWYANPAESPDPNQQLQPWVWPPAASEWGKYIGPGISLPVKREGSQNLGPVGLTLAKIFGTPSVPVSTKATAALTGVGGFREDSLSPEFPICINVDLVKAKGGQILFHPDKEDTGGWTNLRPGWEKDHTDAADIKKFFRKQRGPGDLPPGTEVSLNNGVMCSATKTLIEEAALWHLKPKSGTKNTWVGENDPKTGKPYAYVFPVCKKDQFNQWTILSGVAAELIEVGSAPDDCKLVINIVGDVFTVAPGTYGGGPWYGLLSTEPKLVK